MANHDQGHEQRKQQVIDLPAKQSITGAPVEFDPEATVTNMDAFYKAVSYSKRGKVSYPVFVTDDIYDIVTDGDIAAPLFWKGDGSVHGNAVPIIPANRKQAGLDMFKSKKQTHIVTIG